MPGAFLSPPSTQASCGVIYSGPALKLVEYLILSPPCFIELLTLGFSPGKEMPLVQFGT